MTIFILQFSISQNQENSFLIMNMESRGRMREENSDQEENCSLKPRIGRVGNING